MLKNNSGKITSVFMCLALALAFVFVQAAPAAAYDWEYMAYDFDDPVRVEPGVVKNGEFEGDDDVEDIVFESAGGSYSVTVYCKTATASERYGNSYRLPVYFERVTEFRTDGTSVNGDPDESMGMFYPESMEAENGWYKCTEQIGTFKKGTVVGVSLRRLTIDPEETILGENPFSEKYKVVINGKASYKPDKARIRGLGRGSRSFTVIWRKVSKASGYQVKYAANKSFSKGAKTVTIKKGTVLKKKFSKLKKNRKYYVKVRAYRIVKGKKYYGAWSSVKAVKTK